MSKEEEVLRIQNKLEAKDDLIFLNCILDLFVTDQEFCSTEILRDDSNLSVLRFTGIAFVTRDAFDNSSSPRYRQHNGIKFEGIFSYKGGYSINCVTFTIIEALRRNLTLDQNLGKSTKSVEDLPNVHKRHNIPQEQYASE